MCIRDSSCFCCVVITPLVVPLKVCLLLFFLISLITIFVMAQVHIDEPIQFNENPIFPLSFAFLTLAPFFWVMPAFFSHLFNVTIGKSLKEVYSLETAYFTQAMNTSSIFQVPCKQKLQNIWKFLTYPIPKSEILNQN
eukprot:TRINITY_DN14788_c0_g1_i1.p2 TRINITY_DN14788_c0_g1~~TRINITY_DN14788_c0_g1_i1.p2  ORF type:complete len:138 (+),score=9.27 TRINITY_DN14788_c0_g1_i1:131-544(+)